MNKLGTIVDTTIFEGERTHRELTKIKHTFTEFDVDGFFKWEIYETWSHYKTEEHEFRYATGEISFDIGKE